MCELFIVRIFPRNLIDASAMDLVWPCEFKGLTLAGFTFDKVIETHLDGFKVKLRLFAAFSMCVRASWWSSSLELIIVRSSAYALPLCSDVVVHSCFFGVGLHNTGGWSSKGMNFFAFFLA